MATTHGAHCRWLSGSLNAKRPRRAGPFVSFTRSVSAVGAGAHHFDFHAAVLRAAFGGAVVGHGLLLALAFGVHAVALDALGDQVGLHGFGTADRQALVVGIGADGVGVAHGDDHFEVDALDLADQVVQLGAAFGLEHGLVEVE